MVSRHQPLRDLTPNKDLIAELDAMLLETDGLMLQARDCESRGVLRGLVMCQQHGVMCLW